LGAHGAVRSKCGPRALQGQLIEAALMRIQCLVDAIDLLLQQHIAALVFDNSQALIVGRLEFLKGVPQLVIVVARNGREAGFMFGGRIGDVDVHGVLRG
jgi:hypothetical protein